MFRLIIEMSNIYIFVEDQLLKSRFNTIAHPNVRAFISYRNKLQKAAKRGVPASYKTL